MEKETYDYIINIGVDLDPFDVAFSTKEAAIARARELKKQYGCSEVVYMPEDDLDTNEVVWRSWVDD